LYVHVGFVHEFTVCAAHPVGRDGATSVPVLVRTT